LDQQFCEVISLTNLGRFTRRCDWCGNGAPPAERADRTRTYQSGESAGAGEW
jgi:hypothetical protein